jgi:phthalate 4,5-cis-dihydrodiol dehydrogenase
MNFTDFLYRPRRPEELDTAQGGGVVWSQGAHQVDIVRLLAGGMVRSLRAASGVWDASRKSESAYHALLAFENGVSAALTYSGHAHFDTDEFCDWIGEMGFRRDPESYGVARAALKGRSEQEEIVLKEARTYGSGLPAPAKQPEAHNHFGFVLASCEGADFRVTAEGVVIYADAERKFERLAPPAIPRAEVVDELWAAVALDRRPVHDGAWGLATIETCQAILQSAREDREIRLKRQAAPGDRR